MVFKGVRNSDVQYYNFHYDTISIQGKCLMVFKGVRNSDVQY